MKVKSSNDVTVNDTTSNNSVLIGKLNFCIDNQILKIDNERIELSAKESKLLKIFL